MKLLFKNVLVILFVIIFLVGCYKVQVYEKENIPSGVMQSFLADKPEHLKLSFRALKEEGARNQVLNYLKIGVVALETGYLDIARSCFHNALNFIEATHAANEAAKQARSLWYEEGMKEFKGEPYERAMAYYYRGLLYMLDDDYENARACFKSGLLQDAFAEEQQNKSDFAILLFLEGLCYQKLGDQNTASEAFRELKQYRPDFNYEPNVANLLIIVETGSSPRKLSDGIGHAELKYFRGQNIKEERVSVSLNNYTVEAYPVEDIFWQARTRGGRLIDKILKEKVVFQKTNEKIGSSLTEASSSVLPFLAASPVGAVVGGVLGLIGIAEMGVAAKARPQADTRYWDNLPDTIHLAALNVRPGKYNIIWKFHDVNQKLIFQERDVISVPQTVEENSPFIVWKRNGKKMISHSKLDLN